MFRVVYAGIYMIKTFPICPAFGSLWGLVSMSVRIAAVLAFSSVVFGFCLSAASRPVSLASTCRTLIIICWPLPALVAGIVVPTCPASVDVVDSFSFRLSKLV